MKKLLTKIEMKNVMGGYAEYLDGWCTLSSYLNTGTTFHCELAYESFEECQNRLESQCDYDPNCYDVSCDAVVSLD